MVTKSTTSTGSTRRSSSLPSSNESCSAAFTAAVAPVSGMCLAASGSRKHQQLAVAISVEALVWTPVHTLQPFKLAVHCVVDNLLVHMWYLSRMFLSKHDVQEGNQGFN